MERVPPSVAKENHQKAQNGSHVAIHDTEADDCPPQRGYRLSVWRCVMCYGLAVVPAGLGLLVAYWFPALWLRLTAYGCNLSIATHVIVKDMDGRSCVEKVKSEPLSDHTPQPINIDHTPQPINIDRTHSPDSTELTRLVGGALRYLIHRNLRYVYRPTEDKFVLLRGLDHGYSPSQLHLMKDGLLLEQHAVQARCYGENSIDVPVKPYHVLLVEEVLHPFYIFQVLSVIFWMVDEYYYYAAAVFLISTVSVLLSLFQTRRHLQQLHDMVSHSSSLSVIREGREVVGVASGSLVPGDVLVVPPSGLMLSCDAALLTGHAIVNEAMLTGESAPVTKTPLPYSTSPFYHPSTHKRHTLFCGTQVVQTRYYGNHSVLALVVRTGFSTAKGGMVRSILFPRKHTVKFYADAMKFILLLCVLAACGFAYTLAINIYHHYELADTVLRAFDIITIVVPPALPAALTVGTVYALARLRKNKIYCISPQRVTLCGKVKLVCFDKTGTLTEDSLDLLGLRPVVGGSFTDALLNARELSPCPLLYAIATAHSLATINGKLSGDPIDLRMFQATGWCLQEPPAGSFDTLLPTLAISPDGQMELAVLRQFPFSSELQRMSVLVRVSPNSDPRQMQVYCKGAPETIAGLCTPDSVPADFPTVLRSLTQRGYRVLAVAHRPLSMAWHRAERVCRENVECGLTFGGLVVMQNRLKTQTTPTIATLARASIRTVMITGDHLLTGVCVARECGMVPSTHYVIIAEATPTSCVSYRVLGEGNLSSMKSGDTHMISECSWSLGHVTSEEEGRVPLITSTNDLCPHFHLAVDGKSFAALRECHQQEYQRLLVKGTVFARMSPDQKAQLVCDLQSIGYGVAMCGDGANDCGALKAAHAGISLSETEASVASPFTSKTPDISCVPNLIREGRCALVTSFSIFKFMALYSLAEFSTAAILYSYESNLGDWQYLYIDLILIFAFSIVMGYTGPYRRLVKRRPLGTLAGIHVMVSLTIHTTLIVTFQFGALLYLHNQPWYEPLHPDPHSRNIENSENSVLFQISIFQYVALALALSTAAPYRKPLYTNIWFLLALLVLLPANLYLTLAPAHWWPWLWGVVQIKPHPSLLFSVTIVELALLNFVLSYIVEGYVLQSGAVRVLLRWVRCKTRPRNKYKHILTSLPLHWPPLDHAPS